MLNDSKEPEILGQCSGRQKGSVGWAASLPQMENYLHQRYLELRAQETKVKCSWFIAEGKKWYGIYHMHNYNYE